MGCKWYEGRADRLWSQVVVGGDGPVSLLFHRPAVRKLDPIGFDWGYLGTLPGQLARAILADCLGVEQAFHLWRQFTFYVIQHLPEEGWTLTEREIRQWRVGQPPSDGRLSWQFPLVYGGEK